MDYDFDFKEFAEELRDQAKNIAPKDFSEKNRDYLVEQFYRFTLYAAELISQEKEYTTDQSIMIVQIISEWTFHKTIDLIRSGIDNKDSDLIMQKITFTIFEIAKQNILKIELQELLNIIENKVSELYNDCIESLYKEGIIDEKQKEFAKSQSNIDAMASEIKQDEEINKEYIVNEEISNNNTDEPKTKKINNAVFASLITPFTLPLTILLALAIVADLFLVHKFSINPNYVYLTYAIIISGILLTVILKWRMNTIQEMKFLAERERNEECYTKHYISTLGVEMIWTHVGEGLIETARNIFNNNNTDNLRQELTEKLGYIIPTCRFSDASNLENFEYSILIRENKVISGFAYPDKYMVLADCWDKTEERIPEDAIVGVNPTDGVQVYWIKEEDRNKHKDLQFFSAEEVIIKHLKQIVIKYANDLITLVNIKAYIARAKEINSEMASIIDQLLQQIDIENIRQIFVNLITEEVSVKDICYIFERLAVYSRNEKNPNLLSEKLRKDLKLQICNRVAENNIINSVCVSEDWEKKLNDALIITDDYIIFNLLEELDQFVGIATTKISIIEQNLGKQPVIICSSNIRFPLYQLLVKYISTINVLSYAEIPEMYKINNLGTIEKYNN